MQVKLQVTSSIYCTRREKYSHFIFPSLPCGILLKGIWLFLSLHSTFLMDDLTCVYFEHFKLGKVNCCKLPSTYPSIMGRGSCVSQYHLFQSTARRWGMVCSWGKQITKVSYKVPVDNAPLIMFSV